MFLLSGGAGMLAAAAQQPAEPVDISPINGEVYYLINQLSGLQADLNNGSTTAGAALLQQPRSFTSLTQRWALTRLSGNFWAITNLANGLCMDASAGSGSTSTVQNPCAPATATQQWTITATTEGYVTLLNHGTNMLLDVTGSSTAAGAQLDQSTTSTTPTQSQHGCCVRLSFAASTMLFLKSRKKSVQPRAFRGGRTPGKRRMSSRSSRTMA
jgi:hypothetical protein